MILDFASSGHVARVSIALSSLMAMLGQGQETHQRSTAGLPDGTRLIRAGLTETDLVLIFEHPSFPCTEPGQEIPVLNVQVEALVPASSTAGLDLDALAAAVEQRLQQRAALRPVGHGLALVESGR